MVAPISFARRLRNILKQHWRFVVFQIAGWLLACFYYQHLPAPGYAVACLAAVAALMTVHDEMRAWHKVIWILLIGAFLVIELRAIDNDRRENQAQQAAIREREASNFKGIMDREQKNLTAILTQQNTNFRSTVGSLVKSRREDREQFQEDQKQFQSILKKTENLFEHEQELAESLGGVLIPANDPLPATIQCQLSDDDVMVILGTTASVTHKFPHRILVVHGETAISIDKGTDGHLMLLMEIRGADNRIIARLNRSGFVVNRNAELQIQRPDRSTLIVEDEYGTEVLRARFMNHRVFSIDGILRTRGLTIPIALPLMEHGCMYYTAIDIDLQ